MTTRSNKYILSENVHVSTHARFSHSRCFKCHVFSVCQNFRCDTTNTHLTMKNRVVNLVKIANFELRRISSIHRYLSVEATQKPVVASVMSRLDHCNSLL